MVAIIPPFCLDNAPNPNEDGEDLNQVRDMLKELCAIVMAVRIPPGVFPNVSICLDLGVF